MANTEFVISYVTLPSVSFPNAEGMRAHLEHEAQAWKGFLEAIKDDDRFRRMTHNQGNINPESFVDIFKPLIDHLSDVKQFNQITQRHHGKGLTPPPSDSLLGQLILGLFENGRTSEAAAVFAWYLTESPLVQGNANTAIVKFIDTGRDIFRGALAAEALPFRKASSQSIAGVMRSAKAKVVSLDAEVLNARAINEQHSSNLSEFSAQLNSTAEGWWTRAKRLQNWIVRREAHRRSRHDVWLQKINGEVDKKFSDAERRLEAIDQLNRTKQKVRQAEFDRLLDLFHSQLRLRAPVTLWEARAKEHKTASGNALLAFIALGLVATIAGGLIPYYFGDYIANSFHTVVCTPDDPPVCSREFSAKGPLTLAGLLVVMSILMWAVRLQYRIYLSERHLALDANEKKAFAETYLAIKEGGDVDPGSEAIVLASLFRPTQDGIIKDDDGGMDLSAAAILARQLSKPGA